MFIEEIKFPSDFKAKEIPEDNYYIVMSKEDSKWGVNDFYIFIGISDLGVGYDATICVGKDVDRVYGDRKHIIKNINDNITKYFRKKAVERNLHYSY